MTRCLRIVAMALTSAAILGGCGKKKPADAPRPMAAELPGRAIPALIAGDRAYASGDVQAAERWYTKAIESEPASVDAHYLRARARLDRGNVEGTEADLGRALALDPRHWEAVCLRGVLLERQGKREEAWAAFRDARNLAPNALAPRNNLAFLALLEERNQDAFDLLQTLAREFPDAPRVFNNLALAADRLGRTDDARKARAEALRVEGATK